MAGFFFADKESAPDGMDISDKITELGSDEIGPMRFFVPNHSVAFYKNCPDAYTLNGKTFVKWANMNEYRIVYVEAGEQYEPIQDCTHPRPFC